MAAGPRLRAAPGTGGPKICCGSLATCGGSDCNVLTAHNVYRTTFGNWFPNTNIQGCANDPRGLGCSDLNGATFDLFINGCGPASFPHCGWGCVAPCSIDLCMWINDPFISPGQV